MAGDATLVPNVLYDDRCTSVFIKGHKVEVDSPLFQVGGYVPRRAIVAKPGNRIRLPSKVCQGRENIATGSPATKLRIIV
jgi:hypothetical protein